MVLISQYLGHFTWIKIQQILSAGSFIILSIIISSLSGCTTSRQTGLMHDDKPLGEFKYYLKGVPFIPQKPNYCGPAALAMVMNYYGNKITQDEIAQQVYLPDIKGAFIWDLSNYARKRGLSSTVGSIDLEIIKDEVSQGRPVILLLEEGFSLYTRTHYIVVIGIDDRKEAVVVHSATTSEKIMSYDELLKKWSKMNYLAVRIQR